MSVTLAADPVAAEALAVIDRVLRAELRLERPVRPEDRLVEDLQLDSVSLITLVVELENAFQVALREEDAAEVKTCAELAALLSRRKAEAAAGNTLSSGAGT
jgi:acyl carrier protein